MVFNPRRKTSFYIKVEEDNLKPIEGIYTGDVGFNEILGNYNATVYKQAYPMIKDEWLFKIYRLETEKDMPIEVLKSFIGKGLSLVEEGEKEEEIQPTGICENPNDKLSSQTYLDLIKIDSAWKYACDLPILPIAILDNHFNVNQVDISGNVIGYAGNVNNTTDFHGTAVAGIVSAVTDNGIGIAGTGMNAKMYLTTQGWGIDSTVYSLAQAGYRVINCSWMNSCL